MTILFSILDANHRDCLLLLYMRASNPNEICRRGAEIVLRHRGWVYEGDSEDHVPPEGADRSVTWTHPNIPDRGFGLRDACQIEVGRESPT